MPKVSKTLLRLCSKIYTQSWSKQSTAIRINQAQFITVAQAQSRAFRQIHISPNLSFIILRWKFIKENKKVTKKETSFRSRKSKITRSRPRKKERKQELDKEKKKLTKRSTKKKQVLRPYFFSFVNSHHRKDKSQCSEVASFGQE